MRLLLLSALCVPCLANYVEAETGDCLEDSGRSCDAKLSLLQESHAFTARARATLIRPDPLLHVDLIQHTQQLPFNQWLYIGLTAIAAETLFHERLVSLGSKPIMASSVPAASVLLQLLFLWNCAAGFVQISLVALNSSSYMALTEGKISGTVVHISAAFSSMIGAYVGWRLVAGVQWNQWKARRLMIFCPCLAALALFIQAVLLEQGMIENQSVFFWGVIALSQVSALLVAIPAVPAFSMWALATPDRHKTVFMLLLQCARHGGLILGPAMFSLVYSLLSTEGDIEGHVQGLLPPPHTPLMAYSSMALLYLALVTSVLNSTILPAHMPTEEEGVSIWTESDPRSYETEPEHLRPAARESMVWLMLWFSFERPLFLSVLDSNFMARLTTTYDWSVVSLGFVYVLVACLGILLTFLALVALRFKCSESSVLMATSVFCLAGCFLHLPFQDRLWLELIGDVLIWSSSTVAFGIAEGWASRAAMPRTWFSVENFRLRSLLAQQFTSLCGPPLASVLKSKIPRDIYAVVEVAVMFLSTVTLYQACRLGWGHSAGSKDKGDESDEAVEETCPETSQNREDSD